MQNTTQDLDAPPPMKFDVARKVRVFNTQFEFVEFEMHGLSLSRKRVPISSDLMGLAKDPKAQQLLRSSFQMIDEDSDVSGDRVARLKQFIVKDNLIALPGYGTVILRSNKERFQVAVKALERYVHRFQARLKKKLQTAIDVNSEMLTAALFTPRFTKSADSIGTDLLDKTRPIRTSNTCSGSNSRTHLDNRTTCSDI
jgi:hypothetical protein